MTFSDALRQAKSILIRQVHIDQIQIWHITRRRVIYVFGTRHGCDLVSVLNQQLLRSFTQIVIVFNNQDVQ
jgi:hypothetical protein